ncbi:MAG: hypothetical protein R2710_09235 [Acidimicrobiales bacterium]
MSTDAASALDVRALLQRHALILRFDDRELFFPTEIEPYVASAGLWVDGAEVASPGTISAADLDHRWGNRASLRWVDDDDLKAVVKEEASRLARKLLSPRLGRVGLFGRVLDALFLLSVFVRPTTPRRTTPAAALKAERLGLHRTPVCYARAQSAGEWLVLHYSYFYVMNDWRTGYRGLNDHEADWEQAWIFVDPANLEPRWVAASSHDHAGADLRRHWNDPEVIKEGGHPVLHAGAGSHALFFRPGDYVTRLDVPALRWLLRLQRWARSVLRIHDEATERGLGPALGAPFVESAVGDGRSIEHWDLRMIGDDTPWISDFRGLWGLDTGDPMEGERGPSGPKFDRQGDVRASWADPVGFVGLHGTPPPSATPERVNREKLARALVDIDEQIRRRGRLLPLAQQTGNPGEMAEESARLTELLRQRSELVDLGRRLGSGRPVDDDIRAHLRHPAVPLPPPAGSGWILAFWAAASVPMLLAAIAAIFFFDTVRFGGVFLIAGAVATIGEQLARRHFQAAIRIIGLYAVIAAVFLFAIGDVLTISRYALGALLVTGAGLLFFVNLGELGAAQRFRQRAARLNQAADEAPVLSDDPPETEIESVLR